MSRRVLLNLVKRFENCADDHGAVIKLARQTAKNHPDDADVVAICEQMESAKDGHEVRAIAETIKARA